MEKRIAVSSEKNGLCGALKFQPGGGTRLREQVVRLLPTLDLARLGASGTVADAVNGKLAEKGLVDVPPDGAGKEGREGERHDEVT